MHCSRCCWTFWVRRLRRRPGNAPAEGAGTVMKIKANGISINYQVDGPDGAPWLVLINSVAPNLALGDDQARQPRPVFRVRLYHHPRPGPTAAPSCRLPFDYVIADPPACPLPLVAR